MPRSPSLFGDADTLVRLLMTGAPDEIALVERRMTGAGDSALAFDLGRVAGIEDAALQRRGDVIDRRAGLLHVEIAIDAASMDAALLALSLNFPETTIQAVIIRADGFAAMQTWRGGEVMASAYNDDPTAMSQALGRYAAALDRTAETADRLNPRQAR